MKALFATLLMACVPALGLAQAQAPAASQAHAKPAAKHASKPRVTRSARKAVEEVTPIDDDPSHNFTPAELETAKAVYVGEMKCELGASVQVRPGRRLGMFLVSTRGHRFLMRPVESRTGAIRLEDPRGGAMWLQLGNKSMLMSQKLGQRLADECQGPEQVTYAETLKKNPLPNLLTDAPKNAVASGEPGAPTAAAPEPASTASQSSN